MPKLTIPFSIIGFGVFIWVSSATFGSKADKNETEDLRKRVNEAETNHKLNAQKQDQMLEVVKEIRDTQKWMVQEMWRVSGPGNSQQPPSATPNPLGR